MQSPALSIYKDLQHNVVYNVGMNSKFHYLARQTARVHEKKLELENNQADLTKGETQFISTNTTPPRTYIHRMPQSW